MIHQQRIRVVRRQLWTRSDNVKESDGACFGSTYTKIGTIQRLAWPLSKDDMQICEAFHIFWLIHVEF